MMSFSEMVLETTKKIPKGKVTTYLEIARAIGNPESSRAVGNALNRNTKPDIIPCYRVIRSDGSVGGYASGTKEKTRRLEKDGIEIRKGKVDLKMYFHSLRN
ncbi:MAG: MGMT family protein [Candidatus Aenigmarchaeota archaeon]|nr:MGMT family protein [Candidatus Aenigmarchaeota archaeon]